jgi:ribosomal protein S7
MPRRPLTKKRTLLPDPIYNNISVHMLINRVLKSGKKFLIGTQESKSMKSYLEKLNLIQLQQPDLQ